MIRERQQDRAWADEAIRRINAENNRSADTHLYSVPLPEHWGVQLYLKDELTHPTGSLKHRLAHSLFLYGINNGRIGEGTILVEASSGSTAVSEAYFANLLGLPFIAVMPRTTSRAKVEAIESFGARSHFRRRTGRRLRGRVGALAEESGGHYLDQFTNAERATDWRGNNNIAESIFSQMQAPEAHPVPDWASTSAPGTGGTSATLGRYIRYHRHNTELAVVDPENSAFYPGWLESRRSRRRHQAPAGHAVADRGNRPGAAGTQLCPGRHRPHGPGPGRGLGGGHAPSATTTPACTPAPPPAPTCGASGSSSPG